MDVSLQSFKNAHLSNPNSCVLVTGAAGFVGQRIVKNLVEQGIRVRATDNRRTNAFDKMHPLVEFVEADLTDKRSLRRLFEGAEILFILHPAALFQFNASPNDLERANVYGTKNLLQAASNYAGVLASFIFSTAMVYGKNQTGLPLDESAPTFPAKTNPYAQSKLRAEEAAFYFADKFKIFAVRPTAIYGSSKYGLRKVIDIFVEDFPIMPMPFMGEIKTSVVSVDDVVGAVLHLLANFGSLRNNIYNIADCEPVFIKDAFKQIKDTTGSNTNLLPLPDLFSVPMRELLKITPSTLEFPLWNPYKFSMETLWFELITRLEPEDVNSLVNHNYFNSSLLRRTGFEFLHPTIREGIPAAVNELALSGQLPSDVAFRVRSIAAKKGE